MLCVGPKTPRMQRTQWKGRRVFVTGNTGFKGTWLSAFLLDAGAAVSGYALAPITDPNLHDLTGLAADVEQTLADVRDADALVRALAEACPEVVFHLAAQPLVQESIRDPIGTFGTNVMGTVHLLDAVRKAPSVRAVVVVTSDKCYENVGWLWPYREDEPMGGHDPYSSSKGAAELVTAAYRRTYFEGGPAVATARAGNVIGGGDWSADRLVPDLVRALAADRDPRLRFPGATRPWQHVGDAVNGYLMLAEALLAAQPDLPSAWNFGPDNASACTVLELAERFLTAWGTSRRCVVESTHEPHEAFTLRLDSSRARALLKWAPVFGLTDAIGATAAWYHAWLAGENMRERTFADIAAFHNAPAAQGA